jgi:cell division protease FtsH
MKKKPTFKQFKGKPWGAFIFLALIFAGLIFITYLTDIVRMTTAINYSTFLTEVEAGKIKSVTIEGPTVAGIYKTGKYFETVIPQYKQDIYDILRKYEVEQNFVAPSSGMASLYVYLFLFFIGTGILIWYFMRMMRNGGGNNQNVFTMSKSKAKMFLPAQIKVDFSAVAGADEAKEDLKDVVDFLKNPDKYKRIGAKLTRGILLVGEPGNGKTLLAKATAGEAHCPFFSISGSDFIEVFVGVGAARVRDLFAQARKHAPCIIFIDEIDSVGKQRSSGGMSGGQDEREQTLNQLLAEMDGFETDAASIVVIAATNRVDVLDKALLRPGRFDVRVEVPYPSLEDRFAILKVHARDVAIDPDLDFFRIARGTPGFTGADLANIVNQAALIASKHNQKQVTMENFEEARDKIMLGKPIKHKILSEHELTVTAFHEAGHALVRLLIPEHSEPLHKVTIIPRGRALGVTHWLPERDQYLKTKEQLLTSIMSALGGQAAEELVFNAVTTGASSDFKAATDIAYQMVTSYGMSAELGHVVYQHPYKGDYGFSDQTAEKIDSEVRRIIEECYKKTIQLLEQNRNKLDLLTQELLKKETLYADEIYPLLQIEPRAVNRLV